MAERRPPGFNVDLGFYDSDEVLSIPRRHRAAAVGVWTLCGAYSAGKLTDGHVSAEKLRELGCTPAIRDALMATKPEPLWVSGDQPGAIRFTRWTKWQRTCAEVKGYRESEAERKRSAREARRNAATSTKDETSGRTTAGRPHNVRPEDGDPKTETETETESKRSTSVALVEGVQGETPPKPATGKPAAKRRTQIRDDYMPPKTVIAAIREQHPTVTDTQLTYQHSKFIDHWKKTGTTMADWDAAWRNWMRTSAERGDFARAPTVNGHSPPTAQDVKIADFLAYANRPSIPELES